MDRGSPGLQSGGAKSHTWLSTHAQLEKDYFNNIFWELFDTTLKLNKYHFSKAICKVMTHVSKLSIHCILIYLVPSLKKYWFMELHRSTKGNMSNYTTPPPKSHPLYHHQSHQNTQYWEAHSDKYKFSQIFYWATVLSAVFLQATNLLCTLCNSTKILILILNWQEDSETSSTFSRGSNCY